MQYMILVGTILFALIFISAAPRHVTCEGIQLATGLGMSAASLSVPNFRDIGISRRIKRNRVPVMSARAGPRWWRGGRQCVGNRRHRRSIRGRAGCD